MLRSSAPGLVALAILAGCGGAADAALVASAPSRVEPTGEVERYTLTPVEVQLEAEVSAGASQSLQFAKTTGTLVLAPTRPEASSLELEVAMATATSSIASVADVAKARFLHVEKHPTAAMETRSVRRAPPESEQGYLLYADFTLHGTTRTIAVPADITIDACRARMTCAFTIHRSDFGVIDDGNLEALVSDDVEIRVTVDVPRTSAPAACAGRPRPE